MVMKVKGYNTCEDVQLHATTLIVFFFSFFTLFLYDITEEMLNISVLLMFVLCLVLNLINSFENSIEKCADCKKNCKYWTD